MPNMNGEETLLELIKIKPDIKVILSSGYNEQDVINQFTSQKAAGFFQKPYTPQQLIQEIKRILQEEDKQ